jgi:PAS domain S-box-containing protein
MTTHEQDPRAFLAVGGEMGERTCRFDWSRTPLGPLEKWPQGLKVALSILLRSRQPMLLWWGDEWTHFYNDAAIPLLGKRHPNALSQPARDVWSALWPSLGSLAHRAATEGRATASAPVQIGVLRDGCAEEAHVTFSYSPLPAAQGEISSVLCVCTEETRRVHGERRRRHELRTPPALIPPLCYEWQASEGRERARILIAENNANLRQHLSRLLGQFGEIETASDGESAVARAQAHCPDLIVLDVMLPQLDGFGVLRQLRGNARTASVPIIMLSARGGEESRVGGIQAGADDYLVKPFSARELQARVSGHLQMARLRREASEALRKSHEQFQTVFDVAPVGICLMDNELRIRQINPKARPIFEEIELTPGRNIAEVLHVSWRHEYVEEIVARLRHTLATGEPYLAHERVEERRDGKPAQYYDWQLHRVILPDGSYGVVCYFNDVTNHLKARRALAEADRRKDEFLATLAHELRNPLFPLRNGLEIMKRANGDEATTREMQEVMERQLSALIRLVDDLLDVNRINRGKVELRKSPVALESAIQQAMETSQPLIDAGGHRLAVNMPAEPLFVMGDLTRLAQVFSNILNNAAKHSQGPGHIGLTVTRDGACVIVSVRDTGLGIPPSMLHRVFDLFTQTHRSPDRPRGGLGVGLSLVKGLVELHGGSVEARSAGEGKGSEFIVRLPLLGEGVAGDAMIPGVTRPASEQRRILVVDDDVDAAISVATLLRLFGNETRTAHDGLEGIALAESYRPDVIVLDVGMPTLDGYETARRIREEPWGKDVALIAITGWGREEDRRRSREAGFDYHLIKPPAPAVLMQVLAELPPLRRS